MLSVTNSLTRMDKIGNEFDPDGLAGKSRLRHLCLREQVWAKAEYMQRLLPRLEDPQQLTHLDLGRTEARDLRGEINSVAYGALTASSSLQHLNIEAMVLPAGVWQHVFPAGRQLPQVQSLVFAGVQQLFHGQRFSLDAARLVSCCSELQILDMSECSAELLVALPGLCWLHTLHFNYPTLHAFTAAEVVGVFSQLPGLRELLVTCLYDRQEDLLLPLTQLTQLTKLTYDGPVKFSDTNSVNGVDFGPVFSRVHLCYEVSATETYYVQHKQVALTMTRYHDG
jgi:hypothetical protein